MFDTASSPLDVRDRARRVIHLLNGALTLSHQARPIRFGAAVEFMADGTNRRHDIIEVSGASVRLKGGRVGVIVRGPDGAPQPAPPPKPSDAQRWLQLADADDRLAGALTYFSRGEDWFDIYKALECLFLRFGGERQFMSLGFANAEKIEVLKRTANNERHARLKNKPISDPMERAEARRLLGDLIKRSFEKIGKEAAIEVINH